MKHTLIDALFFILLVVSVMLPVSVLATPDPILRVQTDKSIYYPLENVRINGSFFDNDLPIPDALVGVEIVLPGLGSYQIYRTVTTGSPPVAPPPVEVTNIALLTDQGAGPTDTLTLPSPFTTEFLAYFSLTVTSSAAVDVDVISVNLFDGVGAAMGSAKVASWFPTGPNMITINFSVTIFPWVSPGNGTICTNLYTDSAFLPGWLYPLAVENFATFHIVRGTDPPEGGHGTSPVQSVETEGTFAFNFRHSPGTPFGPYEVTVHSYYPTAQGSDQTSYLLYPSMSPPNPYFFWIAPDAVPTSKPYPNGLVRFDASQSLPNGGEIISYTWDFGDGTPPVTEGDPVTTHSFTSAGTYEVTLNVTDDEGKWGVYSTGVTVYPFYGPTAVFMYTPSPTYVNWTTTFDAGDSLRGWNGTSYPPLVQYHWDWGDTTSNVTTNPVITHKYRSIANFTVTLTVTDVNGLWDTMLQVVWVQNISIVRDIILDNLIFTPGALYRNATQSPLLDIAVDVINNGTVAENVTVTAYFNSSASEWALIGTQVVSLSPPEQTTVHFSWNHTTRPLYIPYIIRVNCSAIGDINPADNTLDGDPIQVKFAGDADSDQDVDSTDVFSHVALAYGCTIGEPCYNPHCDFDGDGDVDSTDIFSHLALNYGQTYP